MITRTMGQRPAAPSCVSCPLSILSNTSRPDARKVRPARPQRVKARIVPLGYVEGLNDARTPHGKRCVSARRGWAGEKSDFFSILLVKHHSFSAIHQHPSFDMVVHSAGQDNLLQVPPLSLQIIDGIPVSHADDVLLDDWTFIQIVRGIVRRGSDDFHASVIGLPIGIGADESGQEGVVDIDDWTPDLGEKGRAEDLHVPSHDHELDTMILQQGENLLLLLRLGLLGQGQTEKGISNSSAHPAQAL